MSAQESMIDELFRLAAEDPTALEQKRREMIAACINNASTPENRRKLIRIQAQIDHERKKFKGDQVHFASYVFGLMVDSLLELNCELQCYRSDPVMIDGKRKPRLVT
jgi:hypothetical protein